MSNKLWEAYQSIYTEDLSEGARSCSAAARKEAAERLAKLKSNPADSPYKPRHRLKADDPISKYAEVAANDPHVIDEYKRSQKHTPEYHPKHRKEEVEELLSTYLVDEGFASDLDSAYVLAEHMSEEWVQYVLDEMRKVDKVAGKKSGGNPDPAYREVKKYIRGMEGKPEGQRKKVPGQKPAPAGKYGSERQSPENIVAIRRRAREQAKRDQSSRFD